MKWDSSHGCMPEWNSPPPSYRSDEDSLSPTPQISGFRGLTVVSVMKVSVGDAIWPGLGGGVQGVRLSGWMGDAIWPGLRGRRECRSGQSGWGMGPSAWACSSR